MWRPVDEQKYDFHRQTYTNTYTHTDIQTDRQTDRHTYNHTYCIRTIEPYGWNNTTNTIVHVFLKQSRVDVEFNSTKPWWLNRWRHNDKQVLGNMNWHEHDTCKILDKPTRKQIYERTQIASHMQTFHGTIFFPRLPLISCHIVWFIWNRALWCRCDMQWRARLSHINTRTSLGSSLRSLVSGCFAFRRENTHHVVIVQRRCALSGLPAGRLGHALDIFVSLLKQIHADVPAYLQGSTSITSTYIYIFLNALVIT